MTETCTFYKRSFHICHKEAWMKSSCSSHLKVVPDDVLRQSVVAPVVTTEHLPALTPKAQSVDHACSQFPS